MSARCLEGACVELLDERDDLGLLVGGSPALRVVYGLMHMTRDVRQESLPLNTS